MQRRHHLQAQGLIKTAMQFNVLINIQLEAYLGRMKQKFHRRVTSV
jgi:hypothetical protein